MNFFGGGGGQEIKVQKPIKEIEKFFKANNL